MSVDPITLARAVVARGHEGTEAHALALALLEADEKAKQQLAATRKFAHSVQERIGLLDELVHQGKLAQLKVESLQAYHRGDGGPGDCRDRNAECCLCAILDCPTGCALHWHPDGCPYCAEDQEDEP